MSIPAPTVRACPRCQATNVTNAVFCIQCGTNLHTLDTRPVEQPAKTVGLTTNGTNRWLLFMGVFIGFVIVPTLVAMNYFINRRGAVDELAGTTAARPSVQLPQLRLVSDRAESSSGYSDVIGEVENISGDTLDHISAVITWRDDAGTFIVAERSVLDVSPLLPGQRSTWDVTTKNRPGMKRYTVSFQRGQQLISHIGQ